MTSTDTKLTHLQTLNPELNIESIFQDSFIKYGSILDLKCKDNLITKLEKDTTIPETGNIYKPFVREWEEKEIKSELSHLYDEAIEIGYCNGQNTKLNALEWHNCNEVNVYGTDVVLFLAKLDDLSDDYNLESSKIKTFFVPKNTSILLFNDTLHFSPCKVDKGGFKAIIILSDATNTELEASDIAYINKSNKNLDSLILKKNKFIICHREAANLIQQNVKANINGINLSLNI